MEQKFDEPDQVPFFHAFISHRKSDNATGATLFDRVLNDTLSPVLEPERPVIFLDVDFSFDLQQLNNYVKKSQNLIVLLTPEFFDSAYCLAEVDTAVRHGVHLVPVDWDGIFDFRSASSIVEDLPHRISADDLQSAGTNIVSVQCSLRKLFDTTARVFRSAANRRDQDHDCAMIVSMRMRLRQQWEREGRTIRSHPVHFWMHGYSSGNKYDGEWRNGQQHGHGTKYWANNGDRYEGEFQDGKRHGRGTYFLASGDRYEGMWNNDLKHGQGTNFWADGGRYEGMWNNDLKHGQGTYFWADGSSETQTWQNGQKVRKNLINFNWW